MSRQRAIRLVLQIVLLLFVFSSNSILAVTHYVSYDGDAIPPYTSWETATFRISIAAQYCRPGDTIRVATGTFFETDSIDMSGGGTVIGTHRDSTRVVMQPNLYTLMYSDSGALRVKRLAMVSAIGKISERAISHTGSDATDSLFIENCLFSELDHATRTSVSYFRADSCLFSECGQGGGPVCWLDWASGNSKFEGNAFISTHMNPGWPEEFISLDLNWNADSSIVRQNVFRGSYTAIEVLDLHGWLIVENNLFLDNADESTLPEEYIRSSSPYVRISNNLFQSANPEFVNGWQIRIGGYQEAYIENNIFVGTLTGVGYDINTYPFLPPPAYLNIRNNEFFLNSPRPNISKLNLFQILEEVYCQDFRDSSQELIATSDGNICSSPMFVDTVSFLLQQGSPAIDGGASNILDLDGSRSDIGLHGGLFGSSYAYQEMAPEQPRGLHGFVADGKARLSFLKSAEADLIHYVVFRSDSPIIPLDSQHVVGYAAGQIAGTYLDTTRIVFLDSSLVNRSELYYTVVAVDNALLSSEPAEPLKLTMTDVEDVVEEHLPSEFQLNQNYPNPFNATTAIVYDLPNIGAQPAVVRLAVYNSLGQQVKVLVDQAQSPGRQVAYWDGNDDGGNAVASGVYFYSLMVSGVEYVKSRKMVMMK